MGLGLVIQKVGNIANIIVPMRFSVIGVHINVQEKMDTV